MTSRVLVVCLIGALAAPASLARADERHPQPQQAAPPAAASRGATIAWTTAGAAFGFGVGLWLGLNAFDEALYSDRKVWTSAIAGAAVGALAGVLVARVRRHATNRPSIERPLANDDAALAFARETIGAAGTSGYLPNVKPAANLRSGLPDDPTRISNIGPDRFANPTTKSKPPSVSNSVESPSSNR
jgi:hypothetical protein